MENLLTSQQLYNVLKSENLQPKKTKFYVNLEFQKKREESIH